MVTKYFILAILWIIYFFFHSFFATDMVKEIVKQKTAFLFRFYRIIYNLISGIGIIALFLYTIILPNEYIIRIPYLLKGMGALISMTGILIIIQSFRKYDLQEFFIGDEIKSKKTRKKQLVVEGISAKVRHPLYLGTILFVTGYVIFSFTIANLIVYIIIILYIFVGIRLEEKKLLKEFSERYESYKKNVPMIFPKI